MSVIRVEGLQKMYGPVAAVDDVHLEVGRGEVVGLLGPSGCGKTTTLRCIAGLEMPTAGTIELAGRIVDSPSGRVAPEKRGVGMVFQSYALWPHMTVYKNVEFPLGYAPSIAKSDSREKVRAALEAVGLEGLEHRYPGELSGGQQQRVAVARAIASEPAVLLFDEPLSNLDAKLRNRVRIELKVLLRRLDATAVYVTHDQKEAMALCDRIAVMSKGVVRQIGSPEEVYAHPADVFVAAFVGDTNIIPFEPLPESEEQGDGSRVPVRLAGQDFLIERGRLPGDGRHGGYAVLRPEEVSLSRSPVQGSPAWEGVVTERLYLGAYVQYLVAVRGSDVQLTVDSRGEAFDVGDACLATPTTDRFVWIHETDAARGAELDEAVGLDTQLESQRSPSGGEVGAAVSQ